MERGDDMRSLDEIFRDAQPSISFAPVNETPKPSGQVLGREFYHDSAGRTIVGDTVTDQMGGGANAPSDLICISDAFSYTAGFGGLEIDLIAVEVPITLVSFDLTFSGALLTAALVELYGTDIYHSYPLGDIHETYDEIESDGSLHLGISGGTSGSVTGEWTLCYRLA